MAHLAGLFWLHEGANRFGSDRGQRYRAARRACPCGCLSNYRTARVTVTMDGATREGRARFRRRRPRSGGSACSSSRAAGKYGFALQGSRERIPPQFPRHRILSGEGSVPRHGPVCAGAAQDPDPQHPRPDRGRRLPRLRGVPDSTATNTGSIRSSKSRGAKELFYIFRDLTSGQGNLRRRTLFLFGAARERPRGARFQQGLQPALRIHAVRHLPAAPQENRLDVRIEAGEKNYH